jgi:methionyl-tRNA formyltransferase
VSLRIGYLCMESVFSVRPLEALLRAGHDVRFVMRPLGPLATRHQRVLKRHRGFDVAVRRALGLASDDSDRNPLSVAQRADIPAYLVGDASSPESVALLKREKIDLIVIAFFNQLLRESVLSVPKLGAINLHPSLLPQYRGPAPLFWTYRDGAERTGLTFHVVATGEDSGDILAQLPREVPFGMAGEDLVDEMANVAFEMTPKVVADLVSGHGTKTPQDESKATRAPRPKETDVVIDASLGARRIFHFVRGVGRWNPLVVDVGGQRIRVIDSIDLDPDKKLPGEHLLLGDTLRVGCDDGVVVLRTRS